MLVGKVSAHHEDSFSLLPSWMTSAATSIRKKITSCWETARTLISQSFDLGTKGIEKTISLSINTVKALLPIGVSCFKHAYCLLPFGIEYILLRHYPPSVTLQLGLGSGMAMIAGSPLRQEFYDQHPILLVLNTILIFKSGHNLLLGYLQWTNPLNIDFSNLSSTDKEYFGLIATCPDSKALWNKAGKVIIEVTHKRKSTWEPLTGVLYIQDHEQPAAMFVESMYAIASAAHHKQTEGMWNKLENGEFSQDEFIEADIRNYWEIESAQLNTLTNCEKVLKKTLKMPEIILSTPSGKSTDVTFFDNFPKFLKEQKNNQGRIAHLAKQWREGGMMPFCEKHPIELVDCTTPIMVSKNKWIQVKLLAKSSAKCSKRPMPYQRATSNEHSNALDIAHLDPVLERHFSDRPELGKLIQGCSETNELWKKLKKKGSLSFREGTVVSSKNMNLIEVLNQIIHASLEFLAVHKEKELIDSLPLGILSKENFFKKAAKILWEKDHDRLSIVNSCMKKYNRRSEIWRSSLRVEFHVGFDDFNTFLKNTIASNQPQLERIWREQGFIPYCAEHPGEHGCKCSYNGPKRYFLRQFIQAFTQMKCSKIN